MYIRFCPNCNCEIKYTSRGNYNRANRADKTCKSCTQQRIKTEDWYIERNNKISIGRTEYWNSVSEDEKNAQIKKMANSISEKYQNRSDDWKEEWKKTCSRTSKEKWSDSSYKEKVSEKIKNNNWSKRSDKEDIIKKGILTKIEKYGKSNGFGKCNQFLVNGLICDGTHEKFYIEWLLSRGKDIPVSLESIKTDIGYYTPDFEYDEYYIDVKSIFTLKVLLGFSSYSKTKKSNPKQLLKMKYINDNIKPVKIILVDTTENELLELSIDEIVKLKENEINKNIFKIFKS
jgi:hypothetical protein